VDTESDSGTAPLCLAQLLKPPLWGEVLLSPRAPLGWLNLTLPVVGRRLFPSVSPYDTLIKAWQE